MNTFLVSLPAILGVVGFVIYYILRKSVTEDPIIKSIIEKLKFEEPDFANRWSGLSSSQKEGLLKDDNVLREKLAAQDRFILDKALTNQFRTNIFVYSLCGILLITGIYLFIKPKPLLIDNIQIQNTDSTSRNLLVDIDEVNVTWTSSGTDEEIFVVLENVATGQQTKKYRGQASDGTIHFKPNRYDNFDKLLSNRHPALSNTIRAIIYGRNESFKSKPFDIMVGVKIICYEKHPNTLKFNAIIDQVIVENFLFAPRISLAKDDHFHGMTKFEASEYAAKPEIKIKNPKLYESSTLVFVVNPADIINDKIIRTDVESIRTAIKALQK